MNTLKYKNFILSTVHDSQEESFILELLPPNTRLQEIVAFDIETTGLNPKTSVVTGISCTYMTDEGLPKTVQFFLTKKENEKEMMELFYQLLKDKSYLISFNGDGFDLPYVNEKFIEHDIPFDISILTHLDLYKWARKYQNSQVAIQRNRGVPKEKIKRPFGNRLSLNAIENFVGINREDEIHGVTMIEKYHKYEFLYKTSLVDDIEEFEIRLALLKDDEVYNIYKNEGQDVAKNYVRQQSFKIRDDMCLHNREDTYNLLKLFSLLSDKILV